MAQRRRSILRCRPLEVSSSSKRSCLTFEPCLTRFSRQCQRTSIRRVPPQPSKGSTILLPRPYSRQLERSRNLGRYSHFLPRIRDLSSMGRCRTRNGSRRSRRQYSTNLTSQPRRRLPFPPLRKRTPKSCRCRFGC